MKQWTIWLGMLLTVVCAAAQGEEYTNPTDNSVLVWIPGGEFVMGSENGDDDEKPATKMAVEGFWLGKYEVTNEQYVRFIEATERGKPRFWSSDSERLPDQPAMGISWRNALAYCEWAELRLPTEAEWEYAARGGKQLEYATATGNIDISLAAYRDPESKERRIGPSPVGKYPPNPFGLYDMAGNVWEWASSLYKPYPFETANPEETADGNGYTFRVMRGGSWYSSARYARSAYRRRFREHLTYDYAGFRVAKSKEDEKKEE